MDAVEIGTRTLQQGAYVREVRGIIRGDDGLLAFRYRVRNGDKHRFDLGQPRAPVAVRMRPGQHNGALPGPLRGEINFAATR